MEKRFTSKDFAMIGGLAFVVLLLVLAMYMVDRQWLKMSEMEVSMREQAQDIRSLRKSIRALDKRLQSGNVVSNGGTTIEEIPKAFLRAHKATQNPDYAEGDWLVQAFGTGIKTLSAVISQDKYASDVQANVLESLLTRNPDTLEWQGLLAKSWEMSKDGLVFTFKLRENVKFSDGKPMTSADVVFTYDFIMEDKIAAPHYRASLQKIKSVEAVGKYEIKFTFKEPYYDALTKAGSLNILPKHFYESYLKEAQKYNQSKGVLMGTGPYRLKDPKNWTPDKGMVELERNPRYWGALQPPYDRMMWKVIEIDSARLTTFRNGDIDDYGARPIEYKRLLEDKDLTAKANHWEYMSPVVGYSYIGWSQANAGMPTPFVDKRVRQAMTYLTDREGIIKDIYLGYAEAALSPFNPRSKQHAKELIPRAYDLAKAQALLKQAGYEDRDNNGVLESADGKPFEFELVFFQDNEDTRRMVLFLKDVYARAGILLKPKPTEWSVMLESINKKDFDAITLGWTSGIETDVYRMFHTDQIEKGTDNFVSHSNTKLDKLIDKARKTVNEKERMPIWQDVERIIYEDQPYTFLMRRKTLHFIDKRIKNIGITRFGLNYGMLPLENYVPIKEQRYHK